MMAGKWFWLLPLLAPAISSDARACSVPAPYQVPSTLQLVEQADVIALARIVDGGPYSGAQGAYAEARLAGLIPIAAIKGEFSGKQIVFGSALLELPGTDMQATPSDPRNLVNAHPDAFAGSCNRDIFRTGMIVVTFLKKEGSGLTPIVPAFARALEDVPTPDSLWVKAVRMYAAIAEKPKAMRRAEMRRQRDVLANEIDDPDARLLALELDRALRDSGP